MLKTSVPGGSSIEKVVGRASCVCVLCDVMGGDCAAALKEALSLANAACRRKQTLKSAALTCKVLYTACVIV